MSYPLTADGDEVRIDPDRFHQQFAADVPAVRASLMAVTQRPVTMAPLGEGPPAQDPAWRRDIA